MDQKPEVEIEARDIVACLRPGQLRRKRARSPLRRLVRRNYALSNNSPQRRGVLGRWGRGGAGNVGGCHGRQCPGLRIGR